jgi:hypothetical protein
MAKKKVLKKKQFKKKKSVTNLKLSKTLKPEDYIGHPEIEPKPVIPDSPPASSAATDPTLEYLLISLSRAEQASGFVGAVNVTDVKNGQSYFRLMTSVSDLRELIQAYRDGLVEVDVNIIPNEAQMSAINLAIARVSSRDNRQEPPKYTFFQKLKNLFK